MDLLTHSYIIIGNLVNSRNLRKVIEDVIEESPVRPKTIRFFRNQMFNMINIGSYLFTLSLTSLTHILTYLL